MSATQTWRSASLVVLLVALPVPALAEPEDATPEQRAGEVHDEQVAPPGEAPPLTPAPPPAPPPPPKRKPTGRFQIGAGYSNDDKFIASAEIAQDSLFGTGQRLSLGAKISARRQLFRLGYDLPHLFGSDLELRTELFTRRDQMPGFVRSATGGGATLMQPLGEHLTGFLGYRMEQVATELDARPTSERTELPPINTRDGRIASLRGGLAYSTLDQPFLPTKGMSLGAAIEVADPRWGSEIQLTRFDGWGSLHQPVGPFTVHLGGSVSTVSSRDAAGVPLSERLHLDGSSVIRGFAPGSIGPRDAATGLSLGGNFQYTARGELEAPLIRSVGISAVGFVDHGGIYDIGGAGSNGTSVGFGLIWRSPIGPLRFDWAFPVAGDRSPHFVFGMGTSF
jgi:outer membrane protein insertion porin family